MPETQNIADAGPRTHRGLADPPLNWEPDWRPDHTGEQLWVDGVYLGCIYRRPKVDHMEWRAMDAEYHPAGDSLQVQSPGGSSDKHRLAARTVLEIHILCLYYDPENFAPAT